MPKSVMPTFVGLGLILGLVSALGPLATDMYLPALPAMADDLSTTAFAIQGSLLVYFVGFGFAQLVWGPLSDRLGRRPVLLQALGLFLFGTLGCLIAPTIEALLLARFVQSLGAAALMVVPRALVRDLYTGAEATKLMGLIMIIIGVSPMFAPLIGSGILQGAGWRAIFGVLLGLCVITLFVVSQRLPETIATRNPARLSDLWSQAGAILSNRGFMGPTLVSAFGFGAFSILITATPFVYIETFDLSPTGFSLAFALNGAAFIVAAQAGGPLVARIGAVQVIRYGTIGFFGFGVVLVSCASLGLATLPVTLLLLVASTACLGLIIPTTMVLALDSFAEGAGLASSLAGALQMLVGAVAAGLAAGFADATVLPMAAFIALSAGCACGTAFTLLNGASDIDLAQSGPTK